MSTPEPVDPNATQEMDPAADATGDDCMVENTDATPTTEDGPQDLEQAPVDEADVEVPDEDSS